ncbi:tetratricopeptide repeat protein [Sinorhizobium americanum]|uniref:tetratricopeptide repeat protein n=1 Tax=Sinorhizobium americanum TaxID=194963 RepID=UPI0007D977A6|nr:tetratricopeptide repeat protein [Sinorhizobium americanum]OAP39192.1 hypothetical protein ATC00_06980 [Sinorhizobium americanum]
MIYFSWADAPRLQGLTSFAEYETNAIFIRDPGKSWYNGAIPGLSGNANELLDLLRAHCAKFDLSRVTVAGTSMGGYAAILFGTLLGAGRVVAIGPQIVLDKNLPRSPSAPVKYSDLAPVIVGKHERTAIDIWYGFESALDLYNALLVPQIDGVRTFGVRGAMHNVLAKFKRTNELRRFFSHIAIGTPFDVPVFHINGDLRERILQAGERFFVQKDYPGAISISTPIVEQISLSSVHFLIGASHFRMKDLELARQSFERAASACDENYDAHHHLGLYFEKKGDFKAAEASFARGLEYFDAPNGLRFSKLAASQFRNGKYQEAIANHQQAISLDPSISRSHFELAMMYDRAGVGDRALHHFQVHAHLKPGFPTTERHISRLMKVTAKR